MQNYRRKSAKMYIITEPRLLPLNDKEVNGTSADRAAPDISSRGMWSTFEHTFYDVRVLHPNAQSYVNTSMPKLHERYEKETINLGCNCLT